MSELFLSVAEESQFDELICSKNFNEFRKLMNYYLEEGKINQYINDNNLTQDIEKVRETFKSYVMQIIFGRPRYMTIDFIKIMINEYDFMITDKFLQDNMHKRTNIDVLVYLSDYFDLRKYIPQIKSMFCHMCHEYYRTINDFEKFIKIGLSIEELYQSDYAFTDTPLAQSIHNSHTTTLHYLLEHGIDFKSYELEALKLCITKMHVDHLKILIQYGADISVLNNIKTDTFSKETFEIYDILQENNINPKITIALFSLMDNINKK